jgi:tetratricopeptide (TPR) repeat protein
VPRGAEIGALSARSKDALQAAAEWSEGCRAFAAGDAAMALFQFEAAAARFPGRVYRLSAALALARLGRPGDADEALAVAAPEWAGDPRYPVALAIAGAIRGDLARAGDVLRPAAERALIPESPPGPGDPEERCRALGDRLAAEEYFSALLLSGFPNLAAEYADRMIARLAGSGLATGEWTERRGDAAFVSGDWDTARVLYERCISASPGALLKLADVAFRVGDLPTEKALRERIYGTLRAP